MNVGLGGLGVGLGGGGAGGGGGGGGGGVCQQYGGGRAGAMTREEGKLRRALRLLRLCFVAA